MNAMKSFTIAKQLISTTHYCLRLHGHTAMQAPLGTFCMGHGAMSLLESVNEWTIRRPILSVLLTATVAGAWRCAGSAHLFYG